MDDVARWTVQADAGAAFIFLRILQRLLVQPPHLEQWLMVLADLFGPMRWRRFSSALLFQLSLSTTTTIPPSRLEAMADGRLADLFRPFKPERGRFFAQRRTFSTTSIPGSAGVLSTTNLLHYSFIPLPAPRRLSSQFFWQHGGDLYSFSPQPSSS